MNEYDELTFENLNYQSYLRITELLSLQHERSSPPHHDELFFIIIHQAAELWFKNMLHEANALIVALQQAMVSKALKCLRRITAIMELQVHQISLLATLTPVEFAGFRDLLKPASGFQSAQFRMLEFRFGIREPFFIGFFEHLPEVVAKLESICSQPSIYDEFMNALSISGFKVPEEVLNRDVSQPWTCNRDVVALLRHIYEDPQVAYHWVLFLESMLDFDEKFAKWRSQHALMVARTIGQKQGTGGSSGWQFLKSRENLRCFPEIWAVRDLIGEDPDELAG